MIRRVAIPRELVFGFADLNDEQREFRLNRSLSKNRYTMGYAAAAKSYVPGGAAEKPKDVHPKSNLAKLIGCKIIYMPHNYVIERNDINNGLDEKNKTVSEAYIAYHLQEVELRYVYFLNGELRSRLDQSYAPARINICVDVGTDRIIRIYYG